MASPVAKNDIRVALINMQEAKNKDTLDAAAEEVKNLLSTLKGENRGKFLKLFQKAYQQTSEKVGS